MEEQIFQMNTEDAPKGYTYWGAGRDPVDGYDRVILFDIPREDLVSLGQLQHAGVGRFSYEPTYIVGNSYANLRIPLDEWKASIQDTFSTAARGLADYGDPRELQPLRRLLPRQRGALGQLHLHHHPAGGRQLRPHQRGPEARRTAHFEALLAGEALLPNPRFLPYEPPGRSSTAATLQMTSSGRGTTGGFYHNAGHLMVDGSFNVNSTSVDAWEAFLSGTHELPYQKLNKDGKVTGFSRDGDVEGVRFPRVKAVLGGPMETDALDENYWTGFRSLRPGGSPRTGRGDRRGDQGARAVPHPRRVRQSQARRRRARRARRPPGRPRSHRQQRTRPQL